MAAAGGRLFSYHKLKRDYPPSVYEDDRDDQGSAALRARAWSRLRRVPVRRRFRVGALGARVRRYLRARVVRSVRASWERVVRRVRDGQAHFGDLFAGNYMFLQVNPTPFPKLVEKSCKAGAEDSRSTRSYLHSAIISRPVV